MLEGEKYVLIITKPDLALTYKLTEIFEVIGSLSGLLLRKFSIPCRTLSDFCPTGIIERFDSHLECLTCTVIASIECCISIVLFGDSGKAAKPPEDTLGFPVATKLSFEGHRDKFSSPFVLQIRLSAILSSRRTFQHGGRKS